MTSCQFNVNFFEVTFDSACTYLKLEML